MNDDSQLHQHDLRYAAQLLSVLADRLREQQSVDDNDSTLPANQASSLMQAERLYRARRQREKYFGDRVFGEPAWDILLDLFIHGERGQNVSVSSACIAASVPPTTALRWLECLVDEGLIVRVPDTKDGRKVFVRLTEGAKAQMHECLQKNF